MTPQKAKKRVPVPVIQEDRNPYSNPQELYSITCINPQSKPHGYPQQDTSHTLQLVLCDSSTSDLVSSNRISCVARRHESPVVASSTLPAGRPLALGPLASSSFTPLTAERNTRYMIAEPASHVDFTLPEVSLHTFEQRHRGREKRATVSSREKSCVDQSTKVAIDSIVLPNRCAEELLAASGGQSITTGALSARSTLGRH